MPYKNMMIPLHLYVFILFPSSNVTYAISLGPSFSNKLVPKSGINRIVNIIVSCTCTLIQYLKFHRAFSIIDITSSVGSNRNLRIFRFFIIIIIIIA